MNRYNVPVPAERDRAPRKRSEYNVPQPEGQDAERNQYAPGQQARATGLPARQYAPGQQARASGLPARQYAPGQMNSTMQQMPEALRQRPVRPQMPRPQMPRPPMPAMPLRAQPGWENSGVDFVQIRPGVFIRRQRRM